METRSTGSRAAAAVTAILPYRRVVATLPVAALDLRARRGERPIPGCLFRPWLTLGFRKGREEANMISNDVTTYLERAGVKFRWQHHPRAVTAQELAASLGISGYEVAKTVLIEADGRTWIAVLPAPEVIDLDTLRAALRASSVRLLNESEFTHLFPGCDAGAEPPFGRLYGLPVILDQDLVEEPEIVFRAGSHEETIAMLSQDFVRLESPQIADFAVTAAISSPLTEARV
jgi:Ala-tRNA(Pro) deacylase